MSTARCVYRDTFQETVSGQASPWVPLFCVDTETERACQDAELAHVTPEDRRRVGRYFAHRLANTIQLLSGRLYLYREEAGPASCPVFDAAQETVVRLEALLLTLRMLGELEFTHRVDGPMGARMGPGAA